APIDRNSINVLLDIYNAHQPLTSNGVWLWLQQISGMVTISLPLATGFNPLCSIQAMPFFGPVNGQCLVLQGGWGLGYLVLLGLALWLAGRVYWRIWAPMRKRPWWNAPDWTLEQRQSALLQGCRLLLLSGTALTLISYAKSSSAAV